MMLKSHVHLIEKGYKLAIQGGHIYKAEIATNKLVEDFGEFHFPKVDRAAKKPTAVTDATPNLLPRRSNGLKYTSTGWVAAEEYHNLFGGSTINYFSATCVVPPLPANQVGQSFAVWIGLSPASDGFNQSGNGPFILQPILAYGPPFENNNYGIFNYFIWLDNNNNVNVASSQAAAVRPGDNIQYVIQYTGETNGSLNFLEEMVDLSNGQVQTPNLVVSVANDNITIPSLNFADIVAEIPTGAQINNINEYPSEPQNAPNSANAVVTNIVLSSGSPGGNLYVTGLAWIPTGTPNGNSFGETATVVSSNNNDPASPGTVDLWFGPAPAPTYASFNITNSSVNTIGVGFNGPNYYNFTVPPGTTTFQVAPGTYNIVLSSGGGKCYYEFFNSSGEVIASDYSDQPLVTISNVPLSAGSYSGYFGNAGD